MPRPLPADRANAPTQGIPQSWVPLAARFDVPGGLRVECLSTVDDLFALGDQFGTALSSRGIAEMYAEHVVMGVVHFYRVVKDRTVVSYGELKALDGKLVVYRDRAHGNVEGSDETRLAAGAFAHAFNAGAVETPYDLDHEGFNLREERPGPRP